MVRVLARMLIAVFVALVVPGCGRVDMSAYPDSTDGLVKLMTDMAAAKENDRKFTSYTNALILPAHDAWFKKAFGDSYHAVNASDEYAQSLLVWTTPLKMFFEEVAQKGRTEIRAVRIADTADENANTYQRLTLMRMSSNKFAIPLYTAEFVKPGSESGSTLWSFAYVDGQFRFLGKIRSMVPERERTPLKELSLKDKLALQRDMAAPSEEGLGKKSGEPAALGPAAPEKPVSPPAANRRAPKPASPPPAPAPAPAPAKRGNCGCASGDLMCKMKCSNGS